jgi:nitroimidazol reductase NimA-like FMN-containing flavoprotein (pyridoxamine 5'-phosphate oxidase superfamily)
MDDQPGRQVRWRELTKSECFELLAREHLGRVAIVDDRGPVVFPVNFVLDRHMVVFRTVAGTKLDAACRGSRVAFEIDGTDAAAHTGWSVVIRGEAVEVTHPAEVARLRKLPLDPWAPGAKTHYVRVLPAVLTGRRILARDGPPNRDGEPQPGGRSPSETVKPWEPA